MSIDYFKMIILSIILVNLPFTFTILRAITEELIILILYAWKVLLR